MRSGALSRPSLRGADRREVHCSRHASKGRAAGEGGGKGVFVGGVLRLKGTLYSFRRHPPKVCALGLKDFAVHPKIATPEPAVLSLRSMPD